MKRAENWLSVKKGNEVVGDYICDYDKAFVRLLNEYVNIDNEQYFYTYFQICYFRNGNKYFKSFKIYNDEEEKEIRNGIPNIPTHTKIKR